MKNEVCGICKDCKRQKWCISGSRGIQCNYYISIKAEREKQRKEYQDEIIRNFKQLSDIV